MRTLRTIALTALLAGALAAVPAPVLAAGDEPGAVEDPPVAVDPIVDPTPVEPAGPEPTIDLSGPEVVVNRVDEPGTTAPRATAVATPVGSLPFTGTDDRRITWLLLAGSLLACAGVTAWCWAAPPARTNARA